MTARSNAAEAPFALRAHRVARVTGEAHAEQVVYSFNGNIGQMPYDVLTDVADSLYGVTQTTLFRLTPARRGYRASLVSFFYQSSDGFIPYTPVAGADWTLYGTTGAYICCSGWGAGSVFEVTTTSSGYGLTYLDLFYFDRSQINGIRPEAGLTMDRRGDLFGITSAGGTCGGGSLFELMGAMNPLDVIGNLGCPHTGILRQRG